jgi:hypothetical protein
MTRLTVFAIPEGANKLSSRNVKTTRIPFSYLLPLFDLCIWVLLVLVPVTLAFLHLNAIAQADGAHLGTDVLILNIPRNHLVASVFTFGTIKQAHFVAGLNLPGTFIEVLISLVTTWPESFHPASISGDSWRAVTFPIFCLPAWWFVGKGLDAFRGRRLHWFSLTVGTLLSIFLLVLILGLRFGMSASEQEEVVSWAYWGLSFWAVAFAIFPIVWVRQIIANRAASNPVQPTQAGPR